ncbi:lysylphosphatidylglycerol synthase transmembrane domain-containing protein [Salipiger bermudensis]|uniref:lysylphosphatidylglycerol synthase transmembrane domain-containing protein n=1 Tax=Salipiger bermudensis TaxID=344736 RepID=UPI001CD2CED9|nr:flippase-like domain-containing protein [Salipiger bermudensis]MCA0961079.1 flippase-like domain-containing protein [Salipiger bermudensis]
MTKDERTAAPGRVRFLLGAVAFLVLSGAAFWAIAAFVGDGMPPFDPRLVTPRAVALIGLFLLVYFVADGLRLYFVLRALDAPVTVGQIAPLVFVNLFFSNITPMATGGGFAQIWYLQRCGVGIGLSAAATSIRTILAMLVIFIAAPLFLVAAPEVEIAGSSGALANTIGAVIAAYMAGFLVLLLRPAWMLAIIDRVLLLLERLHLLGQERRTAWSAALKREARSFSDGFRRFISSAPHLSIAAVLATLAFLLTLFAMPALLMALLGLEPDWLTVIGTLSVVTFLMYFAPTPGGAGFSELAFAGLMAGQIGEGQLVLVIFAWRLLTIYLGMAIGGVVSFRLLRLQGLRT